MKSESSRIELLGTFRVTRGSQLPFVPSAGQRVVALLALWRQPMTRERAAGTLWPDVHGEKSSARLRTTLWRLGPERSQLLVTKGSLLGLHHRCQVDLYEAERLGQALASGESISGRSEDLLDVFSRDLLPDWDEPWLTLDREGYREIRVHALEALARSCLRQDDNLLAIRACLLAIRSAPFRDTAHRLLVDAYRAEGNAAAAMNHIHDYREAMWEELGMTPGKLIVDLEEELAR